jgi:hypothetical protein
MLIKFKPPIEGLAVPGALVCAAMPDLYRILARFEEDKTKLPIYANEIVHTLNAWAMRHDLERWSVTCDATTTSPSLLEEGRLAFHVFAFPNRPTTDYYATRFVAKKSGPHEVELEVIPIVIPVEEMPSEETA